MRYLSEDGSKWIRHGIFTHYFKNGNVASEGNYVDGLENGVWCDYHENGQIAAKGSYNNGKEDGLWVYWDESGNQEV